MTDSTLVIRAVPYDLPEATAMIEKVQAYYRTLYRGPDRAPVDPQEFAPPGGRFFVGYASGRPVAMGGWRTVGPMPSIDAICAVEVKRMYVDEAARGRGYARALLRHLEETAAQAGADAAVLSTGQPQREAIALYRSSGYVDVPRFGYYARYDTAVHLGKRLERSAGGTIGDNGQALQRPPSGSVPNG
jgi:GNAT superfamily N-acetyltransferase